MKLPDFPKFPKDATKEWLEEVLHKTYGDLNEKIVTIKLSPGSAPGDNYASIITAVDLETASSSSLQRNRRILFKHMPEKITDVIKEADKVTKIYEKEVLIYEDILPMFTKFIEKYALNGNFTIEYPTCLFAKHGKDEIDDGQSSKCAILMEDLRLEGYKMWDRSKGMDMPHVKLALKELSKFHAIGYAFERRNDLKLNDKWPLLNIRSTAAIPIFEQIFNMSLENLDCFLKVSKQANVEEKVRRYNTFRQNACKLFNDAHVLRKDFENFNVLCHGDYWCNNFLFSYPNNNNNNEDKEVAVTPETIKVLDWQIVEYGLATTDIAYFFFQSLDYEIRFEKFDELLKYYHDCFVNYCEKFNVNPLENGFTLDGLKKAYKISVPAGAVFAMMSFPTLLSDVVVNFTHDMDVEEYMALKKAEIMAGGNLKQQKRMMGIVDELIHYGYM